MKEYQSHKRVHAAKIIRVEPAPTADGGAALYFENDPMSYVDAKYMAKHQPRPGGYYVVYPDGYKSFSPAEPFEDGYTLVETAAAPVAPEAVDATVGRAVHYVAFGTPGGEYPEGVCRAADVTEVHGDGIVGLCIKNPTGIFFNRNVHYDADKKPGTWHWPERV